MLPSGLPIAPGSTPFGPFGASSKRLGTLVYRAAAQAIANSTVTDVLFDTIPFDDLQGYTSNGRITINQATTGRYLICAGVAFAAGGAAGERIAQILINNNVGNNSPGGIDLIAQGGAAQATILNLCAVAILLPGDFITLTIAQTSGGNLNISGRNTFLSATLL